MLKESPLKDFWGFGGEEERERVNKDFESTFWVNFPSKYDGKEKSKKRKKNNQNGHN